MHAIATQIELLLFKITQYVLQVGWKDSTRLRNRGSPTMIPGTYQYMIQTQVDQDHAISPQDGDENIAEDLRFVIDSWQHQGECTGFIACRNTSSRKNVYPVSWNHRNSNSLKSATQSFKPITEDSSGDFIHCPSWASVTPNLTPTYSQPKKQ